MVVGEATTRVLLEIPSALYFDASVSGFHKGKAVSTVLLAWLFIGQKVEEVEEAREVDKQIETLR